MKTKNKSLSIICSFLLVNFAACEAKEPITSPYPVYDSGAWANWHAGSAQIYWIDNDRVIFKTVKDNDKRNISRGPFNLSVWEIGKEVKAYTPYTKKVSICLRDGIFRYVVEDEQKNLKVFHGKFGEEKQVTPQKRTYFDFLNCRVEDNPEIAEKTKAGRAITKLLDRHGYLDIGPISGRSESAPTILYRPGHLQGITLPVRIGYVDYFSFKDAYFFRGLFKPDSPSEIKSFWPAGTTDIMGWLHPDGRIESVVLSKEAWPDKKIPSFGSGNIVPLRDRFLVLFGLAKGPYDAGTLGGYLLRNNKLTKVVGGYISSLTVSPNGCKVAFVHYPYLEATLGDDPAPIRLKAVDLCPSKEEKSHGQ